MLRFAWYLNNKGGRDKDILIRYLSWGGVSAGIVRFVARIVWIEMLQKKAACRPIYFRVKRHNDAY